MKAIQTRRVLGVVLVEDDTHCHRTCIGFADDLIKGGPYCWKAFSEEDTKRKGNTLKRDGASFLRTDRCLAAEKNAAKKAKRGE